MVQDWGWLSGLEPPIADLSRYKQLIIMNTTLGDGTKPTKEFLNWNTFNNRTLDMKTGGLMGRSCRGLLFKAECDAYDAPYPSSSIRWA